MRTCRLTYLVLISFVSIYCTAGQSMAAETNSNAGGQSEETFRKEITKTVGLRYLLYLPKGYDENAEQKWPLMLFLHGAGERGSNIKAVMKHGPPKLIKEGKDLPFIIASPQCPAGTWWTEELDALAGLLDEVESRHRVDPNRVYLTGLSMGGFGSWALGCRHPRRFAAIAPICGGGEWFLADRLKDVPVWVFHGAKDATVPLRESEEMVGALRRAGGNVQFTVYPEAQHDSWTETYNNPKLYEWFLSHRRDEDKK